MTTKEPMHRKLSTRWSVNDWKPAWIFHLLLPLRDSGRFLHKPTCDALRNPTKIPCLITSATTNDGEDIRKRCHLHALRKIGHSVMTIVFHKIKAACTRRLLRFFVASNYCWPVVWQLQAKLIYDVHGNRYLNWLSMLNLVRNFWTSGWQIRVLWLNSSNKPAISPCDALELSNSQTLELSNWSWTLLLNVSMFVFKEVGATIDSAQSATQHDSPRLCDCRHWMQLYWQDWDHVLTHLCNCFSGYPFLLFLNQPQVPTSVLPNFQNWWRYSGDGGFWGYSKN